MPTPSMPATRIGLPFLGLYGATKFTLEGLTESYRYELAPFGIDAAIIEPGTYPTTNIGVNRRTPADQERAAPHGSALRRPMPRGYGGPTARRTRTTWPTP